MKAIRIHSNGGPEVLDFVETEDAAPQASEVLIRVRAAGVNFIDTYHRTGLYPVNLPFTPGEEAAGEVVAVGREIRTPKVGDRVAYCGVSGSYAELAAVPANRVVTLPDDIDFDSAAALMLQGMTAHYLVNSTYALAKGQTCLVHAAAGGVGLLLIQLAKRKGARVIGTVSTPEKAELAKSAGADEIVLYEQEDFAQAVRRLTNDEGVEVVYDSVGRSTFAKSLTCLKPRGLLALFGQSSGKVEPFDPGILSRSGSLFLTRPTLGNYIATRSDLEARANELMGLVRKGELRLRIGATYELRDAAEAHRALEGRRTTGKVLLIP